MAGNRVRDRSRPLRRFASLALPRQAASPSPPRKRLVSTPVHSNGVSSTRHGSVRPNAEREKGGPIRLAPPPQHEPSTGLAVGECHIERISRHCQARRFQLAVVLLCPVPQLQLVLVPEVVLKRDPLLATGKWLHDPWIHFAHNCLRCIPFAHAPMTGRSQTGASPVSVIEATPDDAGTMERAAGIYA